MFSLLLCYHLFSLEETHLQDFTLKDHWVLRGQHKGWPHGFKTFVANLPRILKRRTGVAIVPVKLANSASRCRQGKLIWAAPIRS